MNIKRKASAVWHGTVKEGNGHLTTQSTVLNKTQYSFNSRFAEGIGTNPEELLAAAHAGCFTMKVSAELTQAGFTADTLETEAVITLENGAITKSELVLKAKVPAIDKAKFDELAQSAHTNCLIGKAFSFPVVLTSATLVS